MLGWKVDDRDITWAEAIGMELLIRSILWDAPPGIVIAVYFCTYFSPFLSNFKTFFLSFHTLTTYEDKTRDKKTSYWYKETSIDYIVHKTDFLKTV